MSETQRCMECEKVFDSNELHWINDNYGIPYKKVCDGCCNTVETWIRSNNYGDELTHDEIYGEE